MSREFDPKQPEWMDRVDSASAEHERTMRSLGELNRRFGAHRLLEYFLALWWNPNRCYRVLDLCTGGGDLPRAMVEWARPRGITLRIDAVDANEHTLTIARRLSEGYPEIHFVQGDALKFEPAESFDLVHCSLVLHHFPEQDAARLLRRCREHSTRWVLVSDLERNPFTAFCVWVGTGLMPKDPVLVHDGRESAKRAFSFREMRALAEAAGWSEFGHSRFLWCRQALWLDRRDFAEIPVEPVEMPIPA